MRLRERTDLTAVYSFRSYGFVRTTGGCQRLRKYHWPYNANTALFSWSRPFDVHLGGQPETLTGKGEELGGLGRWARFAEMRRIKGRLGLVLRHYRS